MQDLWECQALSGVDPHCNRRVRKAITSVGSVRVYLASVSFICKTHNHTLYIRLFASVLSAYAHVVSTCFSGINGR